MVNKMQAALIRKELKGVTGSRSFFLDYMLVPLIMALIIPVGATLMAVFMDNSADEFAQIMAMLTIAVPEGGEDFAVVQALINYVMPMFFLMIPTLTATVMAAASFTGEKERRTLETLLYSPMSLRETFNAKVIGAFLLSMIVTVISFVLMNVVVMGLVWLLLGEWLIPGIVWLVVIGLVAPAFSFIGIIFQVRVSAKAKSSEEAYQRSAILILPLVLMIVSQFTGILLISTWMFLVLGIVLAMLAWGLMRAAFSKFTYEELLK